jgi:3-hydroxyacyl-[acyl-carrier-protein] dehydratase
MDLSLVSRAPLRLCVRFEPGDACFNEHFPGNPVVPGSLIAGICLEAMREHLGCTGRLVIERFSFSRFATPGAYSLDIDELEGGCLCTLSRDATIFARGRITA